MSLNMWHTLGPLDPHHYTTTSTMKHWYKTGRSHDFILIMSYSDPINWMSQQKSRLNRPVLYCLILVSPCTGWTWSTYTQERSNDTVIQSFTAMLKAVCYLHLLFRRRENQIDYKVCNEWREVGQRDPEKLCVPACCVTCAWEASGQRVLHAPRHLRDIRTAQESHGEGLSFHIWEINNQIKVILQSICLVDL